MAGGICMLEKSRSAESEASLLRCACVTACDTAASCRLLLSSFVQSTTLSALHIMGFDFRVVTLSLFKVIVGKESI